MSCTFIKADILALAPQLSTLPDAAWVFVLAFLNDFDIDCDPSLRRLALSFLGAHMAMVSGSFSASGATTTVVSESAGGLKRTYAQPTSTSAQSDLTRTPYGQQYLALMAFSCTRGPFLV